MMKTKRRLALFVLVLAFCLSCIGSITVLAAGNTCRSCGKDIPESTIICPYCWVCSLCGTKNNENATVCKNCGAQNSSGGEQPNGEQTDGEQTDGEQIGGEQTDGEQIGGEQIGGEQTDGEQIGGEQIGDAKYGVDDYGTPLPFPMENLSEYLFASEALEVKTMPNGEIMYWPAGMPLPLNMGEHYVSFGIRKVRDHYTTEGKEIYRYGWSLQFETKSVNRNQDNFGPNKPRFVADGWVDYTDEYYNEEYVAEHYGNLLVDDVSVLWSTTMRLRYEEPLIWCTEDGIIEEFLYGTDFIYDQTQGRGAVGFIDVICYAAEGGFPASGSWAEGNHGSGGNRIIQLEDGTYITVDENGNPLTGGIVQKEDGTYTNQTGTLPVPDYRDYEVGDIVTVGGVAFVLLLVAGVPTWVGPGGIGLDGKSLIPEDGPADTGPKPEPAEPDTPKEPQEEVTPTDEDSGGETGTDGWKDTSGYITEAMKGTPIVTEIMDLLFIMDESGVNVAKLAGPLASAGFDFIDFSAQGSDAVTAGIKTLISAGMKMAAGAGASYTDVALNAMKYEFCEFAKQFENFTGIDTSGIQDMASRITSSVSPGENLKNTAGVMVDFFREGYKCFVTKEGNEFTTGLIEGYRSGKYGENMKNMQLSIDMINDYFSGKPVLEEIRTGLGQMLEETNQSISDYISKGLMGQ